MPDNYCFAGVAHCFLVLQSFLSCLVRFLKPGEGYAIAVPFRAEHSPQAFSLCADTLWVSVIVTIYERGEEEKKKK